DDDHVLRRQGHAQLPVDQGIRDRAGAAVAYTTGARPGPVDARQLGDGDRGLDGLRVEMAAERVAEAVGAVGRVEHGDAPGAVGAPARGVADRGLESVTVPDAL